MNGALPQSVVFDLDGTLVDTAPDLTAALNHTLGELGHPPIAAATVRHLVGHGSRALIERGLAEHGVTAAAEVERGLPLFLDHYAANIATGSRPYPGIETALDALRDAGVTLAICTNKPAGLANALLAALDWSTRFAAVLGSDSIAVRKPHPEHVLATIRAAGGDPAGSVFVGDTAVDVAAAHAAGLPVIVVDFGFSAIPADRLGADAVISHFDALLPALRAVALR